MEEKERPKEYKGALLVTKNARHLRGLGMKASAGAFNGQKVCLTGPVGSVAAIKGKRRTKERLQRTGTRN
jgi:hypothetical protein